MNPKPRHLLIAFAATALMACDCGIAQNLSVQTIVDSAYNMPAFTARYPAGWKFEGSVEPGPACGPIPSPAFHSTSPDGHYQLVVQPMLHWSWSASTTTPVQPGCLPLNRVVGAQEFLQRYVQSIVNGSAMKIVGTMPISEAFRARAQNFADVVNKAGGPFHTTADTAAVRVQTPNGEERLRAWLTCRITSPNGPLGAKASGGTCGVTVDVARTPQGQLDAFVQFVDTNRLDVPKSNEAWAAHVMQAQQQRGQQAMNQLQQASAAGSAMLRSQFENNMAAQRANHAAFMAQQNQQQANHQAWMAQQNQQRASNQANFSRQMQAKSAAASDWQDYSLNRQTVTGANGTYKTYDTSSNIWSSPVGGQGLNGRTLGTDDPNANPNTATDNTWTQDTKVHGNGQPYGH